MQLQRDFADNVGTNIVHFFENNLLGTPRGRAFINFLNSLPIWVPVLDTVSAAATVIAPIENTILVSCPFFES